MVNPLQGLRGFQLTSRAAKPRANQSTTFTTEWLSPDQNRNGRSHVLYDNYEIGKKVGKGGSAKVYEALCKFRKVKYACKVMKKQKTKPEKVFKEIQLLSSLKHKNIVSYCEYYESAQEIFIIMEFVPGGELFAALKKHGRFTENDAKKIISPVLSATAYLHSKAIVHRDIKLENILLRNSPGGNRSQRYQIQSSDVLLIDFGLAKCMRSSRNRTKSVCGSQYYVAPEVLLGKGYGLQVDLWSIGVVLYMLLTDSPPFYETEERSLPKAIVSAKYSLGGELFRGVSADAKDLIRKLLTLEPMERLAASRALAHNWFDCY